MRGFSPWYDVAGDAADDVVVPTLARHAVGRGRTVRVGTVFTSPMTPGEPEPMDVPIRDESIRLGQFLKLANLIESGSDAKPVLADGAVTVNGEVETRRGRQLVPGDVVTLGGLAARVATGEVEIDVPW